MPDEEWAEIVSGFLKERAATVSRDVLQVALMAIDKIDERVAQKRTITKYRTAFVANGLSAEYDAARMNIFNRTWQERQKNRRLAADRRVYVRIEPPGGSA
jgi:hypothetical protein